MVARSSLISICAALLLSGLLPMLLVQVQAQGFDTLIQDRAGNDPAIAKTIPLVTSEATDTAISERLAELYSSRKELQNVMITVSSGMVTLHGEVLSKAAADEAARLAMQLEGVIGVDNELAPVVDIGVRVDYAFDSLQQRLYELISYLPLLCLAVAVVAFFWLASGLLVRWDGLFYRISESTFLVDLAKQVTRSIIVIIGLLIALEIIDATALLGSLVGAVGLLGLAIGIALRDTVENYIASILLSLRRPFAPNDHILIDDHEGKVVRLTSRATILMTFDGNHVRIPNAMVYKGVMTNYTRNPQRRLSFEMGVATEADLTAARALAIKTVAGVAGILQTPPPSCQINSLGDSNVVLSVYGWTDQTYYDFLKVRSACIQGVKAAFEAANFEMPEPIYRLRVEGMGTDLAVTETDTTAATDDTSAPAASIPDTVHLREVMDVSRNTELDEQIAEEAAQEVDLLDQRTPTE